MSQFLSSQLIDALVWTLFHSVWEISIIAILLALVLRSMRSCTAESRYIVTFGALVLSCILALITFSIHYIEHTDVEQIILKALSSDVAITTIAATETDGIIATLLAYRAELVWLWLFGSILFLINLSGGLIYLRTLIASSDVASPLLLEQLEELKQKFQINRKIEIRTLDNHTTPMVTGFLKPIILFPIGLVNCLNTNEVSAVLAHELAHIKRHDFFFNVIQTFMESIFYYHPAIWYITSSIRKERENCCDDLAMSHTSSTADYARTLIRLQEIKVTNYQPALAMAGVSSQLSLRIKRILQVPDYSSGLREKAISILLILSTLMGFLDGGEQKNQAEDSNNLDIYIIDDCPRDENEIKFYLDTIPDKNDFHIKKKNNDTDLELEVQDGIIKELKINGKVIPAEEYTQLEELIKEIAPAGEKDIITIFPYCGDDFGNFYFLDKQKKVHNIDSIVLDLENQLDGFSFLDTLDFDSIFQHSISGKLSGLGDELSLLDSILGNKLSNKFGGMSNNKFQIDSILDLFPNKLPDLTFPFRFEDRFLPQHKPNWFNHSEPFTFPIPRAGDNTAEVLSYNLLKDQLISQDKVSTLELSSKNMKIDGEKQPSNLWRKYKKIYEQHSGIALSKDSKVTMTIDPNAVKFPHKIFLDI